MAPGTDTPIRIEDPALQGGEWLFRRNGQVFGPVDSRTVAAMLYRGDLEPGTEVSAGEGAWVPVGEVPIFVVHAKKAEAAQRVEREVTGARMLRQRRNRRHTLLVVAAAVLLVATGIGGGLLVWRIRGRGSDSPLLEDFGAGIRIASAARVGVSSRAAPEDLIEVPLDQPPAASAPGSGGASGNLRRERSAGLSGAAGRSRSGEVDGGDLVAAQFDERKIQAVVARQQRTLVPCFREEAARSPEFRGDVPIEFAIGNDGHVVALWIDEPRLREGPLRGCLQHALEAWRFETFPGQRPTVSLAFRIGQ
jgi:hypothetical protein